MLGDISLHDKHQDTNGTDSIQNNLVLTLVNIEEETALKNNYPIQKHQGINSVQNPAVHFNLFLLFSANFESYLESLKHISYIFEYFQVNTALSVNDTTGNSQYRLMFSLYNTGFENLNNLWTVLGGKYMPSLIYKMRLIRVQESMVVPVSRITEIQTQEQIN